MFSSFPSSFFFCFFFPIQFSSWTVSCIKKHLEHIRRSYIPSKYIDNWIRSNRLIFTLSLLIFRKQNI